ncbi:MAG TPA: PAS domain S-box protein [bacterium]|nr:PAS domain S-box protein [bacterium]
MDGDARRTRVDAILKVLSDKIFIIDSGGYFIDFLAKGSEDLALPREKIVGSSIFDIFPPDEAERHLKIFKEVMNDGNLRMFEYSLTMDKTERYYEAEITKLSDTEVISIIREITLRVKAEKALKESESRFRELADMLPEVVFETDVSMVVTYVNRKGIELFGYPDDYYPQNLKCIDLITPEERETGAQNIISKMKGDHNTPSEYTGVKKDGTTFPILLHSVPYFKDGKPAGIRGIVVDMSQIKKAERDLANARKLESLGLLAGGIAHDFNNLITGLFGSVDIARKEIKNGNIEETVEVLERSLPAFERAKDLTNQLVTFAKGGEPKKRKGDLVKIVTDTVRFALTGSEIVPEFHSGKQIYTAEFDPFQIGQVIENIIINAKHAMADKGNVEIWIDIVSMDDKSTELLAPGEYVRISIKDSGTGIPAEHRNNIFDPFFTTKKEGTGLGLATSWSIIKRHGGTIDFDSEKGRGTVFRIYIPSAECELESESSSKESFSGRGRILIMDDEFIIREVAGKMLKDAGFTVDKAVNGEEAVEMYKAAFNKGIPYDVIILDLTIPGGMGGNKALQKIKEFHKDVAAICSSGYSEDDIISNPQKYGFAASLPKPYLRETFLEVIRKVMSGYKP